MTVKKFFSLFIVLALLPVPASAAERPTSVKGCAKPTSKAHAPATL
ncbi:MAG: hypothetical protein RL359_447, partial [Actinomycetota bacterium]